MRIVSGQTTPGATNWKQYYDGKGVYLDINTTSAGFTSTPVYITSIGGNSSHWATTGATSIYSATSKGFRVYVRWSDGNPLTPATANGYNWHINWIGMEV